MRLLTVVAVITGCEEESLIAVDEKKNAKHEVLRRIVSPPSFFDPRNVTPPVPPNLPQQCGGRVAAAQHI